MGGDGHGCGRHPLPPTRLPDTQEAEEIVARLRQRDPGLRISTLRERLGPYRPEDLAKYEEGLRKAGVSESPAPETLFRRAAGGRSARLTGPRAFEAAEGHDDIVEDHPPLQSIAQNRSPSPASPCMACRRMSLLWSEDVPQLPAIGPSRRAKMLREQEIVRCEPKISPRDLLSQNLSREMS
jgi:hypothetical protein